MNILLITSILAITQALICYTIGVWAEHKAKILKWWHFAFFAIGFLGDCSGTIAMSFIAERSQETSNSALISVHGITGGAAIILMLIHVIWALIVLIKDKREARERFHRFSLIVWAVWLIPYFIGMFMGMGR